MTKYVRENVEKIERPVALWTCIGFLGLIGTAYLYFTYGLFSNTLEMRQTVTKSELLASKIADNESKYTIASEGIDEAFIIQNGFVVASESDMQYVTVKQGPIVTFRGGL